MTLSLPWIEKYRPKELSEVVGNPNVIIQFAEISEKGNIHHMIGHHRSCCTCS
jgi:replication factor C subunit 2/4